MRCADGLPQHECAQTSVLARSPFTVRLNTSTISLGLITASWMLRTAIRWICGSSIWITGQPASASSWYSSLSASAMANMRSGHALVVAVLHREGDDLRRHRAELHRPLGDALRRLPHRGVLQIAAADRADDRRHHARFQIVVQDVAARKPDAAAPGRRRQRMVVVEAAHVVRRIAGPALAADVVVEAAVAVGDDVEAGELLVADEAGQRVLVLLAEAPRHHRLEEMPGAEIFGVPARPRQRAGDRRRQNDVLGGAVH